MATLPISFLFSIILLLLPHSTTPICEKRYCGSPEGDLPIEFPFQLIREGNNQSNRCGYPGFEVLCNDRKQALLTFPNAGQFVVKDISLEQQKVWINDPGECLPRRFLHNIDLTDSPFQWDNFHNFENLIFLNCTKLEGKSMFDPLQYIPCLSNDEYSIIYALKSPLDRINSSCYEIGSALVPLKDHSQQLRLIWQGLHSDFVLQWDTPLCRYCELDQHCGFLTDTGLDVTCYNNNNFSSQGGSPPTSGPLSPEFLPLAWGISGFLFLFWIVISCVLMGTTHGQQQETSIESNIWRLPVVVEGIDESTIEQYPKIQVGESGQLPISIDNVCSICLGEYEPMETLRSMPHCNHYFHANCIDAWLKMNATCPLCRNLPEGSSCSLPRYTTSYHSSS